MSVEAEQAYEVARRLVSEVRSLCEMLTPDGWGLAYAIAIRKGDLHTARRIDMARKLGAYGGGGQ
jgi:hypothetical protein